VAHRDGVDRQLDIAEWLFARLDAVNEVAVNAALALVGRHRLGIALLARELDLQVAGVRLVVV
jgi:hypothetical protein